MDTIAKESGITERTVELIRAVVESWDVHALEQKLKAFTADKSMTSQYQLVNELRKLLQMKQNHGLELNQEEITQFRTLLDELLGSPAVQGFLEVQQYVRQLHEVVGPFLDRTFERQERVMPSHETGLRNGLDRLYADRVSRVSKRTILIFASQDITTAEKMLEQWELQGIVRRLRDLATAHDDEDCVELLTSFKNERKLSSVGPGNALTETEAAAAPRRAVM